MGCLAGFIALLVGLLGAAPVLAAPVATGWQTAAGIAGTGYFVGQHRNPDGVIAYCVDFERLSPDNASGYTDGTSGSFVRSDGTALSAEDGSALAFVLGRWGVTADDGQAAAVQLAAWSIAAAGMRFDSPAMDTFLKTQGLPPEIATRARSMVEQARAESGPYSITASLTGDETASDTASDTDSDSSGSVESVEAYVVSADGTARAGLQMSATAEGAVFADGSGTTKWTSTDGPHELHVRRTGFGPARVTITAPAVPVPQAAWLSPAEPEVQRLVVAPAPVAVTASLDLRPVAGFTPRVSTSTSAERTDTGSSVFDVLEVTATPPGKWLMNPLSDDHVTLDVVSTLWGPLPEPPAESATVPVGTPSVGSVTTMVSGPGRYETAALTVPSPGYYVWTETIDPSSVQPVDAAPFVEPWSGRFGLAPETTLVPWEPSVTTKLTRSTAASGDLVQDIVAARGFNPVNEDDVVRLTMYGPIDGQPIETAEVPVGTRVHSELDVPARDGTAVSGDLAALLDVGCYTVVASFPGSADQEAFTSAFGIPDETVCVGPRPEPAPGPSPEPSSTTAVIVPAADSGPTATTAAPGPTGPQLAQTGLGVGALIGFSLIGVGGGMSLRILARRPAAPTG